MPARRFRQINVTVGTTLKTIRTLVTEALAAKSGAEAAWPDFGGQDELFHIQLHPSGDDVRIHDSINGDYWTLPGGANNYTIDTQDAYDAVALSWAGPGDTTVTLEHICGWVRNPS